jgi:hypothetical protein
VEHGTHDVLDDNIVWAILVAASVIVAVALLLWEGPDRDEA